jgi:hypothetical protein
MIKDSDSIHVLQSTLELPCGTILKNRIAKSSMWDSLADGEGNPTETQIQLYERWAEGGAAVSFIGEVQGDPRFPPSPRTSRSGICDPGVGGLMAVNRDQAHTAFPPGHRPYDCRASPRRQSSA